MAKRIRGWLAVLLGVAMLAWAGGAWAQSPGAQSLGVWHKMTGPDRSFTAELPSDPRYTATQMKTGTGAAYTMHQYMVEVGDIAYVVQTASYPPDVDISKPRDNLQGGLDNAAKHMDGGKWLSVDWATKQGLTAYDAVGCSARPGGAVLLVHRGPPDRDPHVRRACRLGAIARCGPVHRLAPYALTEPPAPIKQVLALLSAA